MNPVLLLYVPIVKDELPLTPIISTGLLFIILSLITSGLIIEIQAPVSKRALQSTLFILILITGVFNLVVEDIFEITREESPPLSLRHWSLNHMFLHQNQMNSLLLAWSCIEP